VKWRVENKFKVMYEKDLGKLSKRMKAVPMLSVMLVAHWAHTG
jgi:hypothetical protein